MSNSLSEIKTPEQFIQAIKETETQEKLAQIFERFVSRYKIKMLTHSEVEKIIGFFARSPYCVKNLEVEIYNTFSDKKLCQGLVQKTNVVEILEKLVNENTKANQEILEERIEFADMYWTQSSVERSEARQKILEALALSSHEDMKMIAIHHLDASDPEELEIITRLAKDSSARIRARVASRTDLPRALCAELFEDEDNSVRLALLQHLSIHILELSQEKIDNLYNDDIEKCWHYFAQKGNFQALPSAEKARFFKQADIMTLEILCENESLEEADYKAMEKLELSPAARAGIRRKLRQVNPVDMKALADRLSSPR